MYSGEFALYFPLHRRAFDSLRVPAPGNLLSIRKKKANSRGSAQGGGRGKGAGHSWN